MIILDGVDEIPEQIGEHYPRRNFLTLADALPEWIRAGHRVLLTSRPYGVEDAERRARGLSLTELAELPRALQDAFVHRWYAAASAPDGEAKARGLIAHLDERPDLHELRPNPMLLRTWRGCVWGRWPWRCTKGTRAMLARRRPLRSRSTRSMKP